MIISVGYRVKSQNGIVFRRWANKILKDYMLQGYAINQRRLECLEKTVQLIDIANRINDDLQNSDSQEILKVIGNYSKALENMKKWKYRFNYLFSIKKTKETALILADGLKRELMRGQKLLKSFLKEYIHFRWN